METRKIDGHTYRIWTNNTNYVKVGSTYAKKPVYGYAKCTDDDEFDYEKGFQLAKARCDLEVCRKRYEHNMENMRQVRVLLEIMNDYEKKLYNTIVPESKERYDLAFNTLSELLSEM